MFSMDVVIVAGARTPMARYTGAFSEVSAIELAAQRLLLGEANMVLAGGMENMTQAPFVVRGARTGLKLGGGALEDSLMAGLTDTYCGLPMELTAEKLAEQHGITRKDADAYALRSQQAADAAYKACRIKEELVSVEVKQGKKTIVVSEDDHRRPETTMETLEKLPPSFKKDGIVTAGNASGIVDGGAAVVVTREKIAKERGLKPVGRIVSWAVAGVDPSIMGIGPVPSSQRALKLAGLTPQQMDRVEVNEAFAAQYLAVEKVLGLNRDKTNVNGGAIALGHPLGASGTRLVI